MSVYDKRISETKNGGLNSFLIFFGKKPLLTAFILNLLFFCLRLLTMDLKYEVSDDYMQDAVLSGAFGNGYDPYMLFSNPILGFFLKFFYEIIPNVSFYFLFMEILAFISVTIILYVLLKKNNGLPGCLLSLLFLVACADDMYVLVQFTRVAAVAGIAGGVLVLHGLFDVNERKFLYILGGSILTLLASLLRFNSMYISMLFLVLMFIFKAFKCYKDSSIPTKQTFKKIGISFALCVALVGMLYGLYFIGRSIRMSDASNKEYEDFQVYRYTITDTLLPEYEDVQSDYAALGYDEVDFIMINDWGFVDSSVYPNEKLEQVGTINVNAADKVSESIGYSINMLMLRGVMGYWCMICFYLIMLIAALSGKKVLWPFLVFIVTVATVVLFIYTGRTMYRVESSIILCACVVVISTFEADKCNAFYMLSFDAFNRKIRLAEVVFSLATVVITLLHIPTLIPNSQLMNMSDEEYREYFDNTMLASGEYMKGKYGFRSTDRKPHPDIINMMEDDKEHFYYVDFFTGIQSFYFNYDPWIRPEQGLFKDQYMYLGSVALHNSGEKYALTQNGVDSDNPFSGLTKDEILLVDNYFIETKLLYVRKYYAPDATAELVNNVDGFMIWKIYIPDHKEP